MTAGDETCAEGQLATTRATSAIHHAHQPASHASAVAAPGSTGSIAAAASESEMSGGIAGSAATLAGTVQSGDPAEVEPHDRRRDEAAREGDDEHVPEPAGTG